MKRFLFVISMLLVTSGLVFAKELNTSEGSLQQTSKIINGDKSSPDAWPSTVALLNAEIIRSVEAGEVSDTPFNHANYQAQFCGATLIASKWVVTAAHCVVNSGTGVHKASSEIIVLMGTNDLVSTSVGSMRVPVKRIIVHPSYDYETSDADIALLELEYDSSFITMNISGNDVSVGINATTVGWGTLESDKNVYPKDLYEVVIPIVSRAVCESSIDRHAIGSIELTQNMICAGSSGKDSCSGDSGGPLMAIENGEYVVVGISSWGLECAQADTYGVYTRVSKFKNWVDSYANPSNNNGDSSSGGGSMFLVLIPLLFVRAVRGTVVKSAIKKGL